MKISSFVRRMVASALLTAGLAYPACAAVCPKGIGGCTAPGRCFLYVDADANSLCDYTAGTGSSQPSGAFPSRPGASAPAETAVPATAVPDPAVVPAAAAPSADPGAIQVAATPASGAGAASVTTVATPAPDTATTIVQNTASSGFLNTIHLSAPLAGMIIFLVLTGMIFLIVRYGVAGIQVKKTGPALALSAFFSLGLSLVTTSILAGTITTGTTFALVYMAAGTPLAAYLWHSRVMTRKIALGAALISTLAGFVFVAPIMPLELGGVTGVLTGASALSTGIIVICAIILLALAVGRVFCGQICPVGSLQELAYGIPVKKIVVRRTEILEIIRLAVFVVTIFASVYLIDLMALTGLYDLFSLTLSAGFLVAAGLIMLSIFLYRPVCRVLCPFGVLFSVFAMFSLFRLRRTDSCISCRKCEKACPAGTAGADDAKRECYLCGRCTHVCPKEDALVY